MFFEFDLPISKQIRATIAIQQLVRREVPAVITRADGTNRIDPFMKFQFSFTDRRLFEHNQFLAVLNGLKQSRVDDDDEVFTDTIVYDKIIIADCWTISEGFNVDEPVTVTDSIEWQQVTPDDFYTEESYTLDMFNYAFSTD